VQCIADFCTAHRYSTTVGIEHVVKNPSKPQNNSNDKWDPTSSNSQNCFSAYRALATSQNGLISLYNDIDAFCGTCA